MSSVSYNGVHNYPDLIFASEINDTEISIGSSASDRIVVVAVYGMLSNEDVSVPTFDLGVISTTLIDYLISDNNFAALYYATVSSGSSTAITITAPADNLFTNVSFAVWSIYGVDDPNPASNVTDTSNPFGLSSNVIPDSVFIGIGCHGEGSISSDWTITGATKRFLGNMDPSSTQASWCGADYVSTSTQSPRTITIDSADAETHELGIGAVWSPSVTPITGDVSVTLGGLSKSISGGTTISGSASVTLSDISKTITGGPRVDGSLTASLDGISYELVGALIVGGTLSASLDDVSASIEALINFEASLDVTLDSISIFSETTTSVTGSTDATLDGISALLSGFGPETGDLDVTLGDILIDLEGLVGVDLTGNLTISLSDVAISAVGGSGISGTSSTQLPDISISIVGRSDLSANVSAQLASISPTMAGGTTLLGSANISLGGISISAIGSPSTSGTLNKTLGGATLSAHGDVLFLGELDKTLDSISITSASATGTYGELLAIFIVRLSRPSTEVVTVNYTTVSGSAEADTNFTPSSGTITFAPGQTAVQITIPMSPPTTGDNEKQFTLVLSSPTNAVLSKPTATGTVPRKEFVKYPIVSIEDVSGSSLSFTVSLSAANSIPCSVSYSTKSKSAIANKDFVPVSGTLDFAVGETSKAISISVLAKSDRSLKMRLVLNSADKLTLYRSNKGVGTILPDAGVVALVDAAKAAKTAWETAVTNAAAAKTLLDEKWAEWDNAAKEYTTALGTHATAVAEVAAATNNVAASQQQLVNTAAMAIINASFAPLVVVAQNNLNAANVTLAEAQTRLNEAAATLATETTQKDAAFAIYTAADADNTTKQALVVSTKSAFDAAYTAASNAFVGSTTIDF